MSSISGRELAALLGWAAETIDALPDLEPGPRAVARARIVARLREAAGVPLVLYAVRCSNYEPAEVDSLWAGRDAAQQRAEVLSAGDGPGWSVQAWEVAGWTSIAP